MVWVDRDHLAGKRQPYVERVALVVVLAPLEEAPDRLLARRGAAVCGEELRMMILPTTEMPSPEAP